MNEWQQKYVDLAHILKARDEEIEELKAKTMIRLPRREVAWLICSPLTAACSAALMSPLFGNPPQRVFISGCVIGTISAFIALWRRWYR